MDCDAIRAIEKCFCKAHLDCDNAGCENCPIHKYKISENLAVCYFGNNPHKSTEEQINRFLAVARENWNHKWDCRLNNAARKILGIKAKVI